ncbi:hypothetical protein TRAPUB_3317 [Trametes pubescens]|uniref:BTB domain-containing protein n=1 Tax=Trametes pubescens TaxID=154538 RepID=A0A1M2VDZ3_TRAPU|nr:hypothetical protein TRAPUB_3317 [Trametes pubescens]
MSPSDSNTPTPPTLQRDADVWIEDGNIVLVAKRSVAFRLYRGLLAYHSTVFRDMFSIGSAGAEDDEKMDDIPVVHLTDPPDAFRLFLLVLISSGFSTPRWSHAKLPRQLSFPMFDAIMRIAHKYEATHVLPLLSCLLGEMADQSRRGPWGDNRVDLSDDDAFAGSRVTLYFSNDDAIDALDLTRHVGAEPSIVAAMLWQCCIQGPIYLRDGITHDADGVVRRLSEEDYVRCVRALPQLLLARRDMVLQTALSSNSLVARRPCGAKSPTCAEAFCDKYARNLPPLNLTSEGSGEVIPYDGELLWHWSRSCMCQGCYGWLLQDLRVAFKTYWCSDLPKIFQLESIST